MAVYGGSGKNLFTVPTTAGTSELSKNKYNVQVNDTTKIAQVYLQGTGIIGGVGPVGGDINVGTIDLRTGKFTPDANRALIADTNPPGNVVEAELRYFNSPEGSKQLKEVSSRTVQKGVLDGGGSIENAKTAAQNLTGVDPGQTGNANTLAQQDPNLNQSLQSGQTDTIDPNSQQNLRNLKISDDPNTRAVGAYPEDRLLKYPITMSGDQDYVKFTMLKYASRGIELSKIAEGSPLGERGGGTRERGSTVVLPIQPSVSDSNVVKWGSDDMDAGKLIAAASALGTITEGGEGAIASIKAITGLFAGNASNLKTAFAAGFADAAAGTKGLLTRVTGGIVNPNMELLFQGPDLRTFNFNFTLSAREPQEAKVIRNIIRFFKQGMSVKRASTALFLKSPHTFEIKYIHKGKDHPWINKIKECALTSCNVNYTPAGNYATYEDGSMTQYDISLSFSELEPIYDDDYGNGGGTGNETEIGY
jgi:hypothetical protein